MTDPGRFVWFELMTTDPKGAIAFYPEVTGWQPQAYEGQDYTMWLTAQGPVGGVAEMPPQVKAMGAPPFWQANVEVANVDETVAKVTQLGGAIYHREDVPDIGRFAVIADPQGASLSVFTPARDMPSHDLAQPGEFQWHELYTTDTAAAFEFYRQICGWEKLGSFDMGAMGEYLLWGRGGKQLGGMMTIQPSMKTPDGKPVPPSWLYYVTTADLEGALARATGKGARVLSGPMHVPGGQRIVQLMDPQGAVFALVTAPVAG